MQNENGKKILYYDWNSLMQKDMLLSLDECGFDVVLTEKKLLNYYEDSEFSEYFSEKIRSERPDYCFSFNYFPVIAELCAEENVLYVAWVFDSPMLNLYHRSVFLKTNRIFHFDRGICISLQAIGVNILHLPLGARADKWHRIAAKTESVQTKDLTFIGRIYDKKNYYDQIKYLPDHLKGYLEGLMEAQRKVWGYNFLEECLKRNGMDEITKHVKLECPDSFFYTPEFVFSNLFLSQKITAMEREEALQMLAESGPVYLYSDSLPDSIKSVKNIVFNGVVDSDEEAPIVFHDSLINLNYTMRSILTGIPLRIFDIVASGGMVLTNYQEEIPECFEPDKEIVIFGSPEEMAEKAAYYRNNPEEAKAIAKAGYERLVREHTLSHRIRILFE